MDQPIDIQESIVVIEPSQKKGFASDMTLGGRICVVGGIVFGCMAVAAGLIIMILMLTCVIHPLYGNDCPS